MMKHLQKYKNASRETRLDLAFEEGADEQMIKNDIDRATQQVIALCTEHGKETE